MPEPNSSITIAPQVEIIPPMTQIMRDMPTEPLSLKIVAGVENMLNSRQHKGLMSGIVGHVIPSADDLVHNQRDGSQQPDLSALEDICFDDFQCLILAARFGSAGSCLYAFNASNQYLKIRNKLFR